MCWVLKTVKETVSDDIEQIENGVHFSRFHLEGLLVCLFVNSIVSKHGLCF